MSTKNNLFLKVSVFALVAANLVLFVPQYLTINAASAYELGKSSLRQYYKITKKQNIIDLAEAWNRPVNEDPEIAAREYQELVDSTSKLNEDELFAMRKLNRDKTKQEKEDKKLQKVIDKADKEYIKSLKKLYPNKSPYNLNEQEAENLENKLKKNSELVDIMTKVQNPDTIPDIFGSVQAEATTNWCSWDSNWPSSIRTNFYGPKSWY